MMMRGFDNCDTVSDGRGLTRPPRLSPAQADDGGRGGRVFTPTRTLPRQRLCRNAQNDIYYCLVIPGLTRNPESFHSIRCWMPDQVRHDEQKLDVFLFCDTVSQGGGQ